MLNGRDFALLRKFNAVYLGRLNEYYMYFSVLPERHLETLAKISKALRQYGNPDAAAPRYCCCVRGAATATRCRTFDCARCFASATRFGR